MPSLSALLSLVVVFSTLLSGRSSNNCRINLTERLSDFIYTGRLLEDASTIGPKTTTGYLGGNISANATIPLPPGCTGPIIFVNDYKLSTPCTNLTIHHGADGLERLIYTINGVQESVDGTRIDVCIFCGDHYECFSPAYFYVKGRPNITNDDILIKVTCNEVVITGSIDKDVTLTVEIKDSSNITIYKEESLTLPHSVNGSLLNPRDEYQLTLVASNKAGDSNPLIYGFDFDVNVTDFDIRSATVKYVNNIIKLYLDITVNESCPLFIPDHLIVESSCLEGGNTLLYLNKSFSFILDLLMDQQDCVIVFTSMTTKKEEFVDTSRILNIGIWPEVTFDGYYSINATLLNGVTGIMAQVLYLNGTVFFNQSILRNSSNSYIVANSSTRLPNGTFIITVYPLSSDGRSFDSSYTAMNFTITCMMTVDPSEDIPTGKLGKRNVPIWVIVIALIFAIILIIAIIAAILLGVRHKKRNGRWTPRREEREGGEDDGGEDDGGGGDLGGGDGGGGEGHNLREKSEDRGEGLDRHVDFEIPNVVADNVDLERGGVNNNDVPNNNNDTTLPPPVQSVNYLLKPTEETKVPILGKKDRPVVCPHSAATPPDSSEPSSRTCLLPQDDVPLEKKISNWNKKQVRGQPAVPISSEGLEGEQDYVISESIPTRTEDQEKHALVHGIMFSHQFT